MYDEDPLLSYLPHYIRQHRKETLNSKSDYGEKCEYDTSLVCTYVSQEAPSSRFSSLHTRNEDSRADLPNP